MCVYKNRGRGVVKRVTTTRANLSFSAQSGTKLGTSSVRQVCWFIDAELFYCPYPDKFLVHTTPSSALLLLFSEESERFQIHPTTFGRETVARQPAAMSSGPVSTCLMLDRLNDDTFPQDKYLSSPFCAEGSISARICSFQSSHSCQI